MEPQLSQAGVRLIGVGLEELGVEEFLKGEFFKGELYIDAEKKCYKALEFKKLSALSLFPSLLGKDSREGMKKSKEMAVGGDTKGDWYQTGGLLVVTEKGEKVPFEFKQKNAADHASNADILKALNLDPSSAPKEQEVEGAAATQGEEVKCEEVCAMPAKT